MSSLKYLEASRTPDGLDGQENFLRSIHCVHEKGELAFVLEHSTQKRIQFECKRLVTSVTAELTVSVSQSLALSAIQTERT